MNQNVFGDAIDNKIISASDTDAREKDVTGDICCLKSWGVENAYVPVTRSRPSASRLGQFADAPVVLARPVVDLAVLALSADTLPVWDRDDIGECTCACGPSAIELQP